MTKIWLFGAVTFVIALVVGGVAVALVTTRGGVKLLPADSPEGAVQRYLLAIEDEDYREAYDYLSSDLHRRCRYDDFLRGASSAEIKDSRVTLESKRVENGTALIKTRITVFDPGGLFGPSEHSYERTFHLKLEGGQWRLSGIADMPWPVWWCPRLEEPLRPLRR